VKAIGNALTTEQQFEIKADEGAKKIVYTAVTGPTPGSPLYSCPDTDTISSHDIQGRSELATLEDNRCHVPFALAHWECENQNRK
jgi:hypothetical protein